MVRDWLAFNLLIFMLVFFREAFWVGLGPRARLLQAKLGASHLINGRWFWLALLEWCISVPSCPWNVCARVRSSMQRHAKELLWESWFSEYPQGATAVQCSATFLDLRSGSSQAVELRSFKYCSWLGWWGFLKAKSKICSHLVLLHHG